MKHQIVRTFHKYRPAVHKRWLILISGLLWAGVGIFLSILPWKWLRIYNWQTVLIANIVGFTFGIIKGLLVFSKVSKQNIQRILTLPDKVCVFAFQTWQSYGLIVLMMGTGIFLRSTSYVPKYLLAPVYIAVGSGLFISSFRYLKKFRTFSASN